MPILQSLDIVTLAIAAIVLLVFCIWLISLLSEVRLKKALARQADESLFHRNLDAFCLVLVAIHAKAHLHFKPNPY